MAASRYRLEVTAAEAWRLIEDIRQLRELYGYSGETRLMLEQMEHWWIGALFDADPVRDQEATSGNA